MEQEQILSTIKEKVGSTSLSDRSLTDYIANNLPADGAEPDDAYWTKHVAIIKSIQGNLSADVADILKNQMPTKSAEYFVKNPDKLKAFLAEHPELIEKPKPEPNPTEDPKIKALEEQVQKLMQQRKDDDKKAVIDSLRSSVKKQAKDLKVSRSTFWEDAADKVAYEEGDTEASFLEKVKTQYANDIKRHFGNGEKPYGSQKSPNSPQGSNETVKTYFEKKKAKMGKK